MFQSKSKVSQEGFNNVMKGMLARELETDKGRAFAVVDLLCKDCRPRCTYPCAWLFVKFCELELKDYSVSIRLLPPVLGKENQSIVFYFEVDR